MKKISMLSLILIIAGQLFAQRVSESQAAQVCQRFLLDRNQLTAAEGFKLAEVYTQDNGDVALYRYQLPDVGFVVVSASTTTPPVLAYGFEHDFEMIPPVRDLFHLYKEEIACAEKQQWQAKPKAAAAWERYLADEFVPQAPKGTSGGPLLTTTWNQSKYYNTYCPWDAAAGPNYDYRVPNGCVALACAQIMNYHRFPDRGIGSTSYIPQGYPRQTVNFYQHTYHYDAMTNHPTSYANEIAKLAYHFGVAIQMMYTADGSGANTTVAKEKLNTVFKYDPNLTSWFRDSYLDTLVTIYYAALKGEIDSKRPVYYSGCNQTLSSCHAYVLDGYDEDDLFHLNYGWGGSSNGYYALDNFVAGPQHFDYSSEAVLNIRPAQGAEPPQCNGHQRNTASFGYVADGSHTVRPYAANPDCSWMVAAQGASEYQFTFERLDLNEGDYVTIYNGPTTESGVKVALTGSQKPTENFSVIADSVLITFTGNSNNTEHYGFLISYSSTLPPRTCEEVINMPDVWNATLTDGSQDGEKYLPQTSCSWNITHNFISGYAFAFPKFNLGYGDFVDVYNASTYPATLYQRFDSYSPPSGVYSVNFKKMRVHFVSDNWDQSEGFEMQYYALVSVEDYNGLEDLTVYPNPAADQVTVDFSLQEPGNVNVRLLDMTGKTLRQGLYDGEPGANRINFGLADVAKGIYLLEISNDNGKSVRKLTVQ